MTSKTGLIRIAVVLLFIIVFTVVGWAAPVMYATYAPSDRFIESHTFVAEDTTTGADSHHVCFNRTIHQSDSGQVFMELYLVDEDGLAHEVRSSERDRYFQRGTYSVEIDVDLPDDLEPGTYHYMRIYNMRLANGQVVRDFAFESNTFDVVEDEADTSQRITC